MKSDENFKKLFWNDTHSLRKVINYNNEDYEKRWWLIKNSYKHVYACRLYVGSIGEFISRYLMIKEDMKSNDSDFWVFIPINRTMLETSNLSLLNLIGRDICIINKDNYGFWKYVFKKHAREISLKYYEKYSGRRDTYYSVNRDNSLLSLCNIETSVGIAIAQRIGIVNDYVCFHNRDEQYNLKTLGSDFTQFKKRNNSFKNYSASIEYLRQQKIQSVRMGKYVNGNDDTDLMPIIHYAEKYYADFMDLFLLASCKFYVGPNSGLNMVAKAFAKPVLIVNSVYVTVGSGCEINMKENILIPKKYYSKRSGRYLSLRTIAQYERMFADDTSQYEKKGIVIIENSTQEILDAVIEMNERLNGTWKETEEDKLLQQKYMKILTDLNENNRKRFWNGGGTLYKIGSKFLRENRYLIEE